MSRPRDAKLLLLATAMLLFLGVLVVAAGNSTPTDKLLSPVATGPFPPLKAGGPPAALRTATGVVVPVVGEQDGDQVVLTPCAETVTAAGAPLTGAHVVLDPGHGGSESGAVGPAGLQEKAVNLDVALRARSLLEDAGATVVLTRESDLRVTIETRAAIATALQPLVFVSIHHNAAPFGTADQPGAEVYVTEGSPEARRFGGLLWEELHAHLGPFASEWAVGKFPGVLARLSTSGTDFYGVIRRPVDVPSVLSEPLYLSDPDEEQLLMDPDFLRAEATAIRDAAVRFVTTADPGSGFRDTLVSDAPAGGGGGREGCVDPPLSWPGATPTGIREMGTAPWDETGGLGTRTRWPHPPEA